MGSADRDFPRERATARSRLITGGATVLRHAACFVVLAGVALAGLVVAEQGPAGAEDSFVTATGEFFYVDDGGVQRPIKGARVEMCDQDTSACTPMGSTVTSDTGSFTVRGTAGDVGTDRPDPRVRVVATGRSGTVLGGGGTYCYQSPVKPDVPDNATVTFGRITPDQGVTCNGQASTSGEHGAWQLFSNVKEAWGFVRGHSLRTPARDVPSVKVFWPGTGAVSSYRGPASGDTGAITIGNAHAFNEAVVMHQYGQHVLQHFGERPVREYSNGICDSVQTLVFDRHCFWHGERGAVAWTEGWSGYFAEVLTTSLGKNDTASSTFGRDLIVTSAVGTVESPPHPHPNESTTPVPADEVPAKIEGYIAAILWDLHDAVGDVHGPRSSRDRLAQSFATQWDVLVNYDPAPADSGHNRVTDVLEFWRGVAARHPDMANRLSEIYDVNHIPADAADLHVPFVADPPASIVRGASFSASDRTANRGALRTGTSFTTRYYLSTDRVFGPGDPSAGARTVPNLHPGQESTGSVNAVVPAGLTPGRYFVLACADASTQIFETTDVNNCRASTGQMDVRAPSTLNAVTVNPNRVSGGGDSTGTVTLTGPAPAGGLAVALSDNSAAASVPAGVAVPAGSTSVTFPVHTAPISLDANVIISASAGSVTRTAVLAVDGVEPAAVWMWPDTVRGGVETTGNVALAGPAPPGGVLVSLSDDSSAASVPAQVVVPGGSSSASFPVQTSRVARDTTVKVSASANGVTKSGALTVKGPAPSLVTVWPKSDFGGRNIEGVVYLDEDNVVGDVEVTLSSDSTAASVPATVTVPTGARSAAFAVTTYPVSSDTPVKISAGANGATKTSEAFTVLAPVVSDVVLDPVTVLGGATSAGRVTLASPAPPGGVIVSLSTGLASVASVPATVTVAAGATSAVFTVQSFPVGADRQVLVEARAPSNSWSVADWLTVRAARLTSVTAEPSVVDAGEDATGTVTLEGAAGPDGQVITLTDDSGAASLPASLTVPPGASSASFAIGTGNVVVSQVVTITASRTYHWTVGATTYSETVQKSAQLTVLAPEPQCGDVAC